MTPPAAVAAVAGALAAAATVGGFLPPWAAALLLALGMWKFRRPAAILALTAFAAVGLSAVLRDTDHEMPPGGDRPVAARMKIVLTDPRVSGALSPEETPRLLRAELREFTADGGRTVYRFHPGAEVRAEAPAGVFPGRFGSCCEVEGTLCKLEREAASGDDRFLRRLARQGVRAVCRAESWRVTGRENTLRSRLLDGRDALLGVLFRGVTRPETRRLAAALYCGVASGGSATELREFAAAGIVHIFSVSGMHVAVLALCFGWLLRTLPFRWRYGLLVALVWMYVLGTGAGTPAVRAGVMVSLWSLLRMALLRLPGIDVLCWTATLLLVADPAIVSFSGAQYSFLITAALLLLAERGDRRRFPRREAADLVPGVCRSRPAEFAARTGSRLTALAAGAATAFLAGAAVSLHTDTHRIGTGALAANILLALLMPGYFALFFLQLLSGAVGTGRLTAPCFELAFRYLRDFAAFFGENFPDVGAVPPHWSIGVLYVLALLTALRARRKVLRIAAWTSTALIAVGVCAYPFFLPPALLVRSAANGRPALVAVAEPARRHGVIVNLPDADGARAAAEFLWARGIREVEVLGTSGARGIGGAALEYLSREMKIRRLRPLPEKAAARKAGNAAAGSPAFETPAAHRDLFRTTPGKNGFFLDYFDPGSKLYFSVAVSDGDDGRTVTVDERSGRRTVRRFPWSIRPENWEHEFIR